MTTVSITFDKARHLIGFMAGLQAPRGRIPRRPRVAGPDPNSTGYKRGPVTDTPTIPALIAGAKFTSIYADWLPERELALAARLSAASTKAATHILLLNATKGRQLYSSVVDFFVAAKAANPNLQVTSASYFADIYEFSGVVAGKGFPLRTVASLESAPVADLNRYDVILAIGPSDAFLHLVDRPGLRARLIVLDLAFYHQMFDSRPNQEGEPFRRLTGRGNPEKNRFICYSCQPQRKVQSDLAYVFDTPAVEWRWFNYIPLGFRYSKYYRSDRQPFDLVILGGNGRDYVDFEPARFAGKKCLFVGGKERAENLNVGGLDLSFAPKLDTDNYAKMLALCKCAVIPMRRYTTDPTEWSPLPDNVLLSVIDALASGIPLVTNRRGGILRLLDDKAPIHVYDESPSWRNWWRNPPAALAAKVNSLPTNQTRRQQMADQSIAFTKQFLDIYAILERIWREQVVTTEG